MLSEVKKALAYHGCLKKVAQLKSENTAETARLYRLAILRFLNYLVAFLIFLKVKLLVAFFYQRGQA